MKRFLVLLLALATLLSVGAPALAYTKNVATQSGDTYKLQISLVEYDSNGDVFGGLITQAPNNRAYAKNEIVAAVGALTVPSGENVFADHYRDLKFSAKNITFKVTENKLSSGFANLTHTVPAAQWRLANCWKLEEDDTVLRVSLADPAAVKISENAIPVTSSSKTYRFLVFGKVTKDGAQMSFELGKTNTLAGASGTWASTGAFGVHPKISSTIIARHDAVSYLVLDEDYVVYKQNDGNYIIFEDSKRPIATGGTPSSSAKPLFRIEVGRNYKTERLYMYTDQWDGPLYRIHVEPSTKELIFICMGTSVKNKVDGDQIKITDTAYKALKAYYTLHFEKGLGLTAFNEGNLLKEKDWTNMAAAQNTKATVNLQPFVPYVKAQ